ncbi:MAG: ribosome silencing factor [Coxiella-like endosymbiont]|uniref:ribosome silencing factor n=1 Tax=Coxiella-like endosymbiont TaxID=1592897 RepID=UPI00215AC038|nr:ribosome silencing factor [Coxiella-like endosymbiont]UVE59698.1 ribosome silencing factor [Coxiella-like endosymbiont]
MKIAELAKLVTDTLNEHKALQINNLNVTMLTDIADHVIICSAASRRHAGALADQVIHRVKENGVRPLGVEGEVEGEWILIDFFDIIVHIMLPEIRDFYSLEKLWSMIEASDERYEN